MDKDKVIVPVGRGGALAAPSGPGALLHGSAPQGSGTAEDERHKYGMHDDGEPLGHSAARPAAGSLGGLRWVAVMEGM